MQREKWGIILAGGRGKRMHMDAPKCLAKLGNKTLIERVIDNLYKADIKKTICVLGYKKEMVKSVIASKSEICYQREALGTGDAVLSAREFFLDKKCDIVIMASDMPFVSGKTIKEALKKFEEEKSDLLVISAKVNNPTGYGRIVRGKNNEVIRIVEERDCNDLEKKINEVNSSVYICKSEEIFQYLKKVNNNNTQGEYYLTDVLNVYQDNNKRVSVFCLTNDKEIRGINNLEELAKAQAILKE